eukprot:jgi/Tetstr1/449276/TSEL_036479.t1
MLRNRQIRLQEDKQAVVGILTNRTSRSPRLTAELRKTWYLMDTHGITLSDGVVTTNCNAGDFDREPTCGFTYDVATGQRIEDSQGFCCRCTASDAFDQTFTNQNAQRMRGNLYCGIDGIVGGRPLSASAHCLSMSQFWYEGFTIGESLLQFGVTLTVEYPGSGLMPSLLSLSPSVPLGVTDKVRASLLGDLASYQALPVLSEKVLMVGPHTANNPHALFTSNQTDQWLLIDKDMISFDGRECNKVGTSYHAFRFESDRCEKSSGSCLHSQLLDIVEEELARIRVGTTPRFMLTRWGVKQQQVISGSSAAMRLEIPVPAIQLSLLRLELDASSISLVVNASPGELSSVALCTFGRADCSGNFEALTQTGYLFVRARNIGMVDSDYTVTVANCTNNVQEAPAQQLSIRSQETEEVVFEINMKTASGTASSCAVALYDSQARVTDLQQVQFVTNTTKLTSSGAEVRDRNQGGDQGFSESRECTVFCTGMFDFACFIMGQCWSKMTTALAIVLIPPLVAVSICFICCIRRCCRRPRTDTSYKQTVV